MEKTLRIGEFAGVVGVNPKTIRFYEDAGVLPPAQRSRHGWRLYDSEDVARRRFVRGSRATLSTSAISCCSPG